MCQLWALHVVINDSFFTFISSRVQLNYLTLRTDSYLFIARSYASAAHAVSVLLSVCLSQVGIEISSTAAQLYENNIIRKGLQ